MNLNSVDSWSNIGAGFCYLAFLSDLSGQQITFFALNVFFSPSL